MIGVVDLSDIRIEVTSEHEAMEYCQDNGLKFIECIEEDGSLFLLAEDPNKTSTVDDGLYPDIVIDEPKNTVIFTYYPGTNNKMYYVGKKGRNVSFELVDATRYTESAASQKVYFMNKNGSYHWKTQKV